MKEPYVPGGGIQTHSGEGQVILSLWHLNHLAIDALLTKDTKRTKRNPIINQFTFLYIK